VKTGFTSLFHRVHELAELCGVERDLQINNSREEKEVERFGVRKMELSREIVI
jgi:hypothetical protein